MWRDEGRRRLVLLTGHLPEPAGYQFWPWFGEGRRDSGRGRKGGTNALVVNYFGDGGQASGVFAVGEEDNAADFDVAPLGSLDLDFCHGGVAARRLQLAH